MSHCMELNNGEKMPSMGLGTWNSKTGEVENAVKVALNSGYRLLDCALCYGNQKEIGNALKEVFNEGKIKVILCYFLTCPYPYFIISVITLLLFNDIPT